MKKVTILLALVSFLSGQAQKIDKENAPRNPIGFKHKKEHFFLSGDIYASQGKIFDRDGNLTYNYGTRYYYDNKGKIIGNNYNDLFEYDKNGNIIKFQYASGNATLYRFNSNKLLVYEKDAYGSEKIHTYDNLGRVIKTTINKNGTLEQERLFGYTKHNDTLIVDVQYLYKNGRSNFSALSYYLNGYLVKEKVSTGTYRYIVETDSKGNKTDFYDADRISPKHFKSYNRYYSDVNKPLVLEFGYFKVSNTSNKTEAVYIDGVRCTDIAISKGVKPNEKVVYDGLTRTYYSVPNIIPENHTVDTRIPISNILLEGRTMMNYVHDGKFINYIDGYNKVKKRDFAFLGPHMIDYRIDKSLGRTYIIRNYKNISEQKVKPIELFSTDTTSILYIRDLKTDNFFIVDKGKHIDYKKAKFEYLSNGDPVIFIEEIPKYVLTGFRMAEDKVVMQGKTYSGELTSQPSVPKAASNNTLSSDCISGDCKDGWGTMKVGEILTEATFKNSAIDGVAYITYPDGAYYHGEYKNNRRDGFGYYRWDSGNIYIGNWKNGTQHGLGYTMNSKNEIVSAGFFENGKLSRDEFQDYKNKKSNGNCVGNCINGFGQFTYNNGDRFWGFFKNGFRSDVGTYLWSNKSMYVGTYTNDGKRNGFGIYTYVDRSVFRGMFVNDKIDGIGRMYYAKSGNNVNGVFNNKGAKIREY